MKVNIAESDIPCLGPSVVEPDIVLPCHADGAVHLDTTFRRIYEGLTDPGLGNARFFLNRQPFADEPGSLIGGIVCCFLLDPDLGKIVLNHRFLNQLKY